MAAFKAEANYRAVASDGSVVAALARAEDALQVATTAGNAIKPFDLEDTKSRQATLPHHCHHNFITTFFLFFIRNDWERVMNACD